MRSADYAVMLVETYSASSKRVVQGSLSGEVLPEERFSVLGFVPIDVVGLTKEVWFRILDRTSPFESTEES